MFGDDGLDMVVHDPHMQAVHDAGAWLPVCTRRPGPRGCRLAVLCRVELASGGTVSFCAHAS